MNDVTIPKKGGRKREFCDMLNVKKVKSITKSFVRQCERKIS